MQSSWRASSGREHWGRGLAASQVWQSLLGNRGYGIELGGAAGGIDAEPEPHHQ